MSSIYYNLVDTMHAKFGIHDRVSKMTKEEFLKFLEFRVDVQAREEVDEFCDALKLFREAQNEAETADMKKACEEMLDAVVDLLVFTFGTANFIATEDQIEESFRRVMLSNLSKEVGVKPGRPNVHKLPDLIKPEGWIAADIRDLSKKLEDRLEVNV